MGGEGGGPQALGRKTRGWGQESRTEGLERQRAAGAGGVQGPREQGGGPRASDDLPDVAGVWEEKASGGGSGSSCSEAGGLSCPIKGSVDAPHPHPGPLAEKAGRSLENTKSPKPWTDHRF